MQALNLNTVAAVTDYDVVGNFRELDVMRGGEGAPLAPFGDELFEADLCVNLGGVANLGCRMKGWDICLCNLVLNHYAKVIAGEQYDEGGKLGREGNIVPEITTFSNKVLTKDTQKSLGR